MVLEFKGFGYVKRFRVKRNIVLAIEVRFERGGNSSILILCNIHECCVTHMASSNASLMIQFRKYKKNILDISKGAWSRGKSSKVTREMTRLEQAFLMLLCFSCTLYTTRIGSY